MHFELFLLAFVGLILLGLVQSTEKILEIRQTRREQGNGSKIYL